MRKFELPLPHQCTKPMLKIKKLLENYDIIDLDVSGDAISCSLELAFSNKIDSMDERYAQIIKTLKKENESLEDKLCKVETDLATLRESIDTEAYETELNIYKQNIKGLNRIINRLNKKIVEIENKPLTQSRIRRAAEKKKKQEIAKELRKVLKEASIEHITFCGKVGIKTSEFANTIYRQNGTVENLENLLSTAKEMAKEDHNEITNAKA